MSQERVRKLEALLARVLRNRGPEPLRALATQHAPVASVTSETPAGPPVMAAPPVAFAPPLPVTPEPPPVATASWRPEPGSAVQSRPSTVPPMELSDDDLLDATTLPPDAEVSVVTESIPAHAAASDDEEQAPSSSSRFKVPETLDEAISNAAQLDGDREIPVQTPPPESGPQEALPAAGLEASRLPHVDHLEADLIGPPSMGPTAEQLGETIELEAPRGPELEIDVTVVSEADEEQPPTEELEVTLPRASLPSGLYDVTSAPPPAVTVEAPPRAREALTMPARAGDHAPERTIARPAIGATDVADVHLVVPSTPKTFVELLDGSLGL